MAEGRILYIEDNFDNRILIKRILEAEGYTVIEAENGTVGLKLAQDNTPDLILMDINLPDLDGYECTTRLRKMDGFDSIPILALTANVLEGDRQKALVSGCDDYIPKPIDVDELPNQIAAHLKNNKKTGSEPVAPPADEKDKAAPEKPAVAAENGQPVKSQPIQSQMVQNQPAQSEPVQSQPVKKDDENASKKVD
ncbi:MAG: response regulator [Anaerolineae bacterium]|nr:response regulator [Anaerolineae bacterium]